MKRLAKQMEDEIFIWNNVPDNVIIDNKGIRIKEGDKTMACKGKRKK